MPTNYDFSTVRMPTELNRVLYELYDTTHAPNELIFTLVLSTLSTVLSRKIDVCLPWNEVCPTHLYCLGIVESGGGKSSADRLINDFYSSWCENINKKNIEEYNKFETEEFVWKNQLKHLDKTIKYANSSFGTNDNYFNQIKTQYILLNEKKPILSQYANQIFTNTTIPALLDGLSKKYPYTVWNNDEAGEILKNLNISDISTLNQIYDGKNISINRISRKIANVSNCRLTLTWMVQPDVIEAILIKKLPIWKSSGLLGRLLICMPPSLTGYRKININTQNNNCLFYLDRFKNQLSQALIESFDSKKRDVLKLDPEAIAYIRELSIYIETESIPEIGEFSLIPEFASKCVTHVIKIAALLSYYCNGTEEITRKFCEYAVSVVFYFMQQQINLINISENNDFDYKVNLLVDWFEHQDNGKKFTLSHLLRYGPRPLRLKKELLPVLDELVLNQWVIKTNGSYVYKFRSNRLLGKIFRAKSITKVPPTDLLNQ